MYWERTIFAAVLSAASLAAAGQDPRPVDVGMTLGQIAGIVTGMFVLARLLGGAKK